MIMDPCFLCYMSCQLKPHEQQSRSKMAELATILCEVQFDEELSQSIALLADFGYNGAQEEEKALYGGTATL